MSDTLHGRELWIWDFDCPDGFTVRDSIQRDSTVTYGKQIWGQNVLLNNSKVVYDAKNSITLQPGFEVKQGSTFRTRLIGCQNNASSAATSVAKQTPIIQFKSPNQDGKYPNLSDFLNSPMNINLRNIYYSNQFRKEKITWKVEEDAKMYRLILNVDGQIQNGFLWKKL